MTRLNSRGIGITQVLIGIGVISIVVAGLTTMTQVMQSQAKSIMQKQELAEFKAFAMLKLSDPAVCNWQMLNKTLDVSMSPTQANPSPAAVTFAAGTLRVGPDATSPALAIAGQPLPNSVHGMRISTVEFKDYYPSGSPDEYIGSFEFAFDPATLAGPTKPVRVLQIVRTAAGDPLNAKRIVSCAGGGGGGGGAVPSGGWCGLSYTNSTPANAIYINGVSVPAGAVAAPVLCEGHDPRISCPAGYTRLSLHSLESPGGTTSGLKACVKN